MPHSSRSPADRARSSAAQREFLAPLPAPPSVADVLFMEVHPDPEQALSDSPTWCPCIASSPVSSCWRIGRAQQEAAARPARSTDPAGSLQHSRSRSSFPSWGCASAAALMGCLCWCSMRLWRHRTGGLYYGSEASHKPLDVPMAWGSA